MLEVSLCILGMNVFKLIFFGVFEGLEFGFMLYLMYIVLFVEIIK